MLMGKEDQHGAEALDREDRGSRTSPFSLSWPLCPGGMQTPSQSADGPHGDLECPSLPGRQGGGSQPGSPPPDPQAAGELHTGNLDLGAPRERWAGGTELWLCEV